MSAPQGAFEGSRRQARGRLLAAAAAAPVGADQLAAVARRSEGEARAAAASLVADGLARWGAGGALELP